MSALRRTTLPNTESSEVIKILRHFDHIKYLERPNVMTEAQRLNHNRPLRIKFLTRSITEKAMNTKLMKSYKANECNIHKRQLADMVNEVRIDFINRFIQNSENHLVVYKELLEFKNYVVDCYKKIEDVYGLKCYKIVDSN